MAWRDPHPQRRGPDRELERGHQLDGLAVDSAVHQGSFIVRSMFRPETLADIDLEALADRLLADLTT